MIRWLHLFLALCASTLFMVGCVSGPSTAEIAAEHFSLGKSYLELGKYQEAADHFEAARRYGETRKASEYELARIYLKTDKASDAIPLFESLLAQDEENTMLLQATAYAYALDGDYPKALNLYDKVRALLPDNKDVLYNYGLLLKEAGQAAEGYALLKPYVAAYPEDSAAALLFARLADAAGYVEAVDLYSRYLSLKGDDVAVRFEYAEVCERGGLYAVALETYDAMIADSAVQRDKTQLAKARFRRASVLLTAAAEPKEGLLELSRAVEAGFSDVEAARKLLADERLADPKAVETLLKNVLEKKADTSPQAGSDGAVNAPGAAVPNASDDATDNGTNG